MSDERFTALKAYNKVRAEMQRAAVDAVERIHTDLHIARWKRDNPEATGTYPAVSEMCIDKVDCIHLGAAVNKVKHTLARVVA